MPAIHPPPARLSRALQRLAFVAACAFGATQAQAVEFAPFEDMRAAPPALTEAVALDGTALALGARADRPILLHFFATWCAPCRDELPELARFARAHADRVAVIGVDVAEPAARVQAFVAPFGLSFPVTLDPDRSLARRFGVRVLPSTVAIATGGVRTVAAAGPVDWAAPATLSVLDLPSAGPAFNDMKVKGDTP